MLFNLQGTSLAAANFDILSQNFSFVKYFFQVFPNFFSFCSFCPALVERSHILAHHLYFVKYFFRFFTIIFSVPQIVVYKEIMPLNMRAVSPSPTTKCTIRTSVTSVFCDQVVLAICRAVYFLSFCFAKNRWKLL